MRRFRPIALLALAVAVSLVFAGNAIASPTDTRGDLATVTINAKLRHGKVVVLPHSQWHRVIVHRGYGHKPARAAYHYTCSHSTYWWYYGGWYHRYYGYRLYPWAHTHVYTVTNGWSGLYYGYTTGPC